LRRDGGTLEFQQMKRRGVYSSTLTKCEVNANSEILFLGLNVYNLERVEGVLTASHKMVTKIMML
jgi:hypothetical protein